MKFQAPEILYEYPTEDVIKLYFNRPNGKIPHFLTTVMIRIYYRTILSEQQNHRCCWCKCRVTEIRDKKNSATIEHIIPKSLGGEDHLDNYAVACYRCNNKRGISSVEEFLDRIENAQQIHRSGDYT